MANEFHDNYWILDTLGTVSEEPVKIRAIRWVSAGAAAGHQIVLTDADGNTVWETVATGANYVEESRVPVDVPSLTLFARSSGTVYIYLE